MRLQERSLGAVQPTFSCLDSLRHCLIVCEDSVIRACDSDQLWYVLEVAPHGILALGGTVQEFDLLRHFEIDGAQWTHLNIGDWQVGVHRAFVRRVYLLKPEHLCPALHGMIYDLGYTPFQQLQEFSVERGFFPVVERGTSASLCRHTPRGMQTAELERPPRVAHDLGLPHWTEQQMGEAINNRCVKVTLRESLITEEDIAAANDILDADQAKAAMEEAVKKTSGEDQVRGSGGQTQKHHRRKSQRPTKNCSSRTGNNLESSGAP